jgi:UDP-2,3-diacylglucosamine hydrolase
VKVSKPNQDLRFDLPAVGVHTIAVMASVHAGALAIEAGKTIIFDKEEMIRLADSNRISIVSRWS